MISDRSWRLVVRFEIKINNFNFELITEPRCIDDNNEQKHVGEEYRKGIFQWICMENGRAVKGSFIV